MLSHEHSGLTAQRTETTHIGVEILMVDHVRSELIFAEEEPTADIAAIAHLSIVDRGFMANHRVNTAEHFTT